MTARGTNRCTKKSERRSLRHLWLMLLSLLTSVACYSALPAEEHVCRECTTECPSGLVCENNRCVPPDDRRRCEAVSHVYDLCVGRPATTSPVSGDNLVVLSSTLPDGLEFDPASGTISGTPLRESMGELSVRDGELGGVETTIRVTATERCAGLVTARIEWCAGKDESSTLQAKDDALYRWETTGLPRGVEQDGADLSGNIAEPGTYSFRVTLVEDGTIRAQGEIEIVVAECKDSQGTPDGGAPAPLQLGTTSLGEACAGAGYTSAPLQASGGDGQYAWSLEGDARGFSIDAETGVLSAASPASGHVELSVRVEDGEGATDTQSVELEVLAGEDARCNGNPAVPLTITSRALISGCAGRAYLSPPLEAAGGDGSYGWSLSDAPGWLSINPQTNALVGTPPQAGSLEVGIRVEDGKGARDDATLTLEVRAANDPECGATPPEITTTELADACIGDPYVQQLTATGGAGDLDWRHQQGLPSGLTLDAAGTISGIVEANVEPGEYQVTFLIGSLTTQAVVKTLPLRVRACGSLVFIGEDAATSRLLVTGPPYLTTRELSHGLLGPGEGVISFRRSSASSKLAFLVGNSVGVTPARLYTADAATRSVRQLDWGPIGTNPSVVEYVWSTDGTHVGVVASTAQQQVLAVVSGETGEITSTANIGSYLGKLFSVEDRLCYLVPGRPLESDLLCNRIVAGELTPSQRQAGFFDILIEGGSFVAGEQSYLAVFGSSTSGPVGQAEYVDLLSGRRFPSIDHVFSSTLRWAAGLNFDGDQFELIVSEPDLESEDPIQLAPLPDCEAVLAWSKDERTLVCQGSAGVRVFQLQADGSLERSFEIAGSEDHLIGEARRVISADGRWFAYDSGLSLYLADLSAPVPTSVSVHEQQETSIYSGLALDDARGRLFYHHASQLRAIALETGAPLPLNGSVLLSPPPSCRLNYLNGPDLWCGADTIPATFFPSPGSDEVAFLSTSRQLHVTHLERLQDDPRQVSPLPVKCTRPDGEIRCNEHVAWVHHN